MTYILLVAGFGLLLFGGEALVRGSVAVARRFNLSPLLIGLTLVGFGTSTPELVTSIQAAMIGSPGIAVGNVVGSNICNILFILGIAAIIQPLRADPAAFARDGTVLALSAAICGAFVAVGHLGRLAGTVLVSCLAAYVIFTFLRERRMPDASATLHAEEASAADPGPRSLLLALIFTFGGIGMTVLGADLLVDAAVFLARAYGVSETVIGLTIVAVGTSLPELVTSLVAAVRRQPDVAFGNVVGSNIFNALGILGVTALVQPIPIPTEILRLDLWVMLAATALLIVFTVTGWRLNRIEGGVFLGFYAAYLGALAFMAAA
jgi:cation:H+ antiporter